MIATVQMVERATVISGRIVPSKVLKLKKSEIKITTTTSGIRRIKSESINALLFSLITGSPKISQERFLPLISSWTIWRTSFKTVCCLWVSVMLIAFFSSFVGAWRIICIWVAFPLSFRRTLSYISSHSRREFLIFLMSSFVPVYSSGIRFVAEIVPFTSWTKSMFVSEITSLTSGIESARSEICRTVSMFSLVRKGPLCVFRETPIIIMLPKSCSVCSSRILDSFVSGSHSRIEFWIERPLMKQAKNIVSPRQTPMIIFGCLKKDLSFIL